MGFTSFCLYVDKFLRFFYNPLFKVFIYISVSLVDIHGGCCGCCTEDHEKVIYVSKTVDKDNSKDYNPNSVMNDHYKNIFLEKDYKNGELLPMLSDKIKYSNEDIPTKKIEDKPQKLDKPKIVSVKTGEINVKAEKPEMKPKININTKVLDMKNKKNDVKLKKTSTLVPAREPKEIDEYDLFNKSLLDHQRKKKWEKVFSSPYMELLKLYSIDTEKTYKFFEEYEKVEKNFNGYFSKYIKDESKASFHDHIIAYKSIMRKNKDNLLYSMNLANSLNAQINSFHDLNIKEQKQVAFVEIGEINYLQAEDKNIIIDTDVYIKAIKTCFYKLLPANVKTPESYSRIGDTVDKCFKYELQDFTGQNNNLKNAECHAILDSYNKICDFHNFTFIVLTKTNDQNTVYKGDINIENNYKNVGLVLNAIYSNIIAFLNSTKRNK